MEEEEEKVQWLQCPALLWMAASVLQWALTGQGALGSFSQHSQQEGQSFLPQPCVSSMCWQLSQKRSVIFPPPL